MTPEQRERYSRQIVFQDLGEAGQERLLAACAAAAAEAGVPCFVAMEQWMGCGVGACLGCVVPAAGGGYLRVCSEGPVFAAEALDWEALAR